MSFQTTALLLTWVALVLLALVVAGLVRQVHQLAQGPGPRETGLRRGSPAPGLDVLTAEPGRPTLVLFLSEDCPACHDVFQEAVGLPAGPAIRAVFADEAIAADPPGNMSVLTGQADLFSAYEVPATPYAVIVGADGRVRETEAVGSVRGLHALVERVGVHRAGDAELNGTVR